jgi:hypothetical protein
VFLNCVVRYSHRKRPQQRGLRGVKQASDKEREYKRKMKTKEDRKGGERSKRKLREKEEREKRKEMVALHSPAREQRTTQRGQRVSSPAPQTRR